MKNSLSHVYKVISVSDQNVNYKISNVESKNTATCWRTSKTCSQASFEIKFAPIKLHHIDIITSFSPQVEVYAYNKDVQDRITDEHIIIPKINIFNYNEILEGNMTTKTKKFDLYNQNFIPDIKFSYMRVTVFNPHHELRPMNLGMNSFILFCKIGNDSAQKAPNLSFLEQRTKEVDEQLRKAVGFDRLEASTRGSQMSTAASPATDRRLSLFSYRDPSVQESKDIYGGFSAQRNRSSGIGLGSSSYNAQRNQGGSGIGLESVVPGLKKSWEKRNQENINDGMGFHDPMIGGEKKVRPNYMNNSRSNLGRPILRKQDRFPEDNLASDDDLERALRESEQSYKKEKEIRNNMKNYDEEEFGAREMSGLRKINETDERTQDNEDFQRAIQASKEAYLQENDGPKMDMIGLVVESQQDECNGKTYIDMLERIAEEEEDEIGEIPEDEAEENQQEEQNSEMSYNLEIDDLEKEEKTEEVLTEVLEDSMAKLWSTEDDENEAKNKNHGNMEIEERKEAARRFPGGIEEEVNPRIKLTFELDKEVFPEAGARNFQTWGQRDTDNMIQFVEKDFYNIYLYKETQVRNDAEKKKRGASNVEVVTSYEKIMDDVVFCLAGFEGDEKKSLKDLGISMGARFLDDIYANLTTHLITNEDTMTKKYQRAKKMKEIVIVSSRWLIECYGQKKRLPEKDFIFDFAYHYDKDENLFD